MQWHIARALQCVFAQWLSSTLTLVALKVVTWTVNGVGLQTAALSIQQQTVVLQVALPILKTVTPTQIYMPLIAAVAHRVTELSFVADQIAFQGRK